jgi:hypothetical protein
VAAGGIILVLVFFGAARGVNAMGKLCAFSAVKGVVLSEGKPVAGARVVREYVWSDSETVREEVTTNGQGEFQFPAAFRTSLLRSFLPHQPFTRQIMHIIYQDREYLAWSLAKMNYDELGETGGREIDIVCRLEHEPTHSGEVFGICEFH